MPKNITQYTVFIGSPGGLSEERKEFRTILERFSRLHCHGSNVSFFPVGWEDTTGGVGRPQAIINEDLKQCDYAVFVLHDRWGSPTGNGHTSGTEEEWALSQTLYESNKIRNIALFFKAVDPGKLADPGEQLRAVLNFKTNIEREKRYLFNQYSVIGEFSDALEGHLAAWLRDHDKVPPELSFGGPVAVDSSKGVSKFTAPGFEYWIEECRRISEGDAPDGQAMLFCATKAADVAMTDVEWAAATNALGVARHYLGSTDEAIRLFSAVSDKFSSSMDSDRRVWCAKALVNKGIMLNALGRGDEEIAVYDDVVARYGTAGEAGLRQQVAKALVNKGSTLDTLGRSEDAIAVYDDVVARYGTAVEVGLREAVAKALVNKGLTLGTLGRSEDAITVYDEVLARYGTAVEAELREQVASAIECKAMQQKSSKPSGNRSKKK